MTEHSHTGPLHLTTDAAATAEADKGQEHAGYLRTNALSLVGNVVIALGSVAPTASIALTLSAIVATTSYASPIAVLVCAVPMLGIAMAYRRLNMWHVNCGGDLRVGRPGDLAVLRMDDGLGHHPGLLPGCHLHRLSDWAVRAVARVQPLGGLDGRGGADRRDRDRGGDRGRLYRHPRHVPLSGRPDPDQGGAIVNTASTSGLLGEMGIPAYNASKGAVVNLTRQLAADYTREGIRVNCVCPGWIPTGFNDPVLAELSDEEVEAMVVATVPMGRQGTPEEIAAAVAFLASDDATYITGHALVVDGGLTACR
jgi:NAD(P)-dependent dehydrogenase (short-subunit alcohol dehydrogenase family)